MQEQPHPQSGQGFEVGRTRLGQGSPLKKGTRLLTSRNTFSQLAQHHSSRQQQVVLAERSTILDVSNLFCDV